MAEMLIDGAKLDACNTAEADAIRAKTGGSSPIPYDYANNKGFADAIAAIPSGTTITDGIVVKARDANGYATEVDFYNSEGIVPIRQFSGNGESPWYRLSKINIMPENIVVGANAFRQLVNLNDAAADTIFSKVVEVNGATSFYGLTSITTAIFPKCSKINGNGILKGCSNLQTVKFPVCESVNTGSNEDGILAYLNSVTELVVGGVGHPYAPLWNGHFLYGISNASLIATFFVSSGSNVDKVLTSERKGRVQAATIVIKAANELEYEGTSYAAGETILTSEVTA